MCAHTYLCNSGALCGGGDELKGCPDSLDFLSEVGLDWIWTYIASQVLLPWRQQWNRMEWHRLLLHNLSLGAIQQMNQINRSLN